MTKHEEPLPVMSNHSLYAYWQAPITESSSW